MRGKRTYWFQFFVLIVIMVAICLPIIAYAKDCPGVANPWGYAKNTGDYTGCSTCGGTWKDSSDPTGYARVEGKDNAKNILANQSTKLRGTQTKTITNSDGTYEIRYYRCKNCGVCDEYSKLLATEYYFENGMLERTTGDWSNAGPGYVPWWYCTSCKQEATSPANVRTITHLHFPDKVSFNTNGSPDSFNPIEVMYNQAYGTLPTPSWEGYIFKGWAYSGQDITSTTLQKQNKDHTLIARWEADIPSPTPEPVATNTPTPTPEPTPSGATATPTTPATSTPTPTPETYTTVIFNPNGGTVSPTSKNVVYGQTYGELPVPEKENYDFMAWRHAESNKIVTSTTSVITEATHTLTAIWIRKPGVVATATPTPTTGATLTATPTPSPTPSAPASSRRTDHLYIYYFTTDEEYTLNSVVNNSTYKLANYTTATGAGTLYGSEYTKRASRYLVGTDSSGNTWYFLADGTNATYVHPAVYQGNNADNGSVKNITELIFPSTITYNGTSYTVVSIGGGSSSYHTIGNNYECDDSTSIVKEKDYNYKPEVGVYYYGETKSSSSSEQKKEINILYNYGVIGNGEITSIGVDITNYSNGEYTYITNESSYYVYNTTLKSVTIPDTVTEIMQGAFAYCQALEEINGAKNVNIIKYDGFKAVTIGNRKSQLSKTYVQDGYMNHFYYYYNESYSLDEKTDIMMAFDSSVVIAPYLFLPLFENLVTIDTNGFANHNNLYDVILGSTVSNIKYNAFDGCELESIDIANISAVIGDNVTTLGSKGKVANRTIIYTQPDSTAMEYGLKYREYYELYCGYPITYKPNGGLGEDIVQSTRLRELYTTLDVVEYNWDTVSNAKVEAGIDNEGNLWYIGFGTMKQISPGTKFTKLLKPCSYQVYAYDSDGNLWVSGRFKNEYYTDYDAGTTKVSYSDFIEWKKIKDSNLWTNMYYSSYALFALNEDGQLIEYRGGTKSYLIGTSCPQLVSFIVKFGNVYSQNIYYGIDVNGQKWWCDYKETESDGSVSFSYGAWAKYKSSSWWPSENNNGNLEPETISKDFYIGYEFSDTIKDKNIIPDRYGYAFVEWNTSADGTGTSYQPGDTVVLTEPITLYAIWKVDRQVMYLPNGGTGTMEASVPTEGSTEVIVKANGFTPPSTYKFYAWNTSADRTGTWYRPGDTIYNVTGAYKLYAQWTFIQYVVQFGSTEYEYGTEISVSRPVDYGTSFKLATKTDKNIKLYYDYNNIGMSTIPTMIGTSKEYDTATLRFLGWKLYRKTSIGYDRVDNVLYASGQTVQNLTTTDGDVLAFFPDWDGTGSVTLPTLQCIGYIFKGWTENQEEQDFANAKTGSYTFSDSKTMYAMWEAKEYKVTLNGQGATNLPQNSVTMTFDSAAPDILIPSKNGYVFKGYFTKPNGAGEEYYDETGKSTQIWTIADGSITSLYAKWEAVDYKMYLNPQQGYFLEDDGSKTTTIKEIALTYNTADGTDISSMLPSRVGYTFTGWYTESTGGIKVHDKYGYCTNDGTYFKNGIFIYPSGFTLFSGWSANKYNITIDLNKITGTGTSTIPYPDITVTFDSSNHTYNGTNHDNYLKDNLPTRDGYDFVGLYDTPENGTKVYDSTGNPTNEGTYFKDGVYVYPDNTTFYTYWTPKQYTITFDWNFDWDTSGINTNTNWTGSTKTVTYDAGYGSLPNPTREGYEFVGWFLAEDSEGNGAGTEVGILTPVTTARNHTLYAKWSISYMEEADVWLKPLRESTWVAAVSDGEVGLCKMKEYGNTLMNVTVTTNGYFDYLQVNVPWADPIVVKFTEGTYDKENDIWYLPSEDYIPLFGDIDPDVVRRNPGYENQELPMTVEFYRKDGTIIITYKVDIIFIPYSVWRDEIIVGREPVTEDE